MLIENNQSCEVAEQSCPTNDDVVSIKKKFWTPFGEFYRTPIGKVVIAVLVVVLIASSIIVGVLVTRTNGPLEQHSAINKQLIRDITLANSNIKINDDDNTAEFVYSKKDTNGISNRSLLDDNKLVINDINGLFDFVYQQFLDINQLDLISDAYGEYDMDGDYELSASDAVVVAPKLFIGINFDNRKINELVGFLSDELRQKLIIEGVTAIATLGGSIALLVAKMTAAWYWIATLPVIGWIALGVLAGVATAVAITVLVAYIQKKGVKIGIDVNYKPGGFLGLFGKWSAKPYWSVV